MVRVTETGQLVSDDGHPVTTGRSGPPMGERSGVTIHDTKEPTMAKAEKSGIYRFGKTQIKVMAGAVIPAGAEPIAARKVGPAPENRTQGPPPENRDEGGEPVNLGALSRDELIAEAERRGIENPDKLGNMDQIRAAIAQLDEDGE